MTLIDQTYFTKGETSVPNLNRPEEVDRLNNYIEKYDLLYRENVLGYLLNDEFEAGLLEPTIDAKWTALRDGATFEYRNRTYKWKGFLRASKESPIANYVMWYYIKENNDKLSGVGTNKADTENSNIISPINRMVSIWQWMKNENDILRKFLLANESEYSNYDPIKTLNTSVNVFGI